MDNHRVVCEDVLCAFNGPRPGNGASTTPGTSFPTDCGASPASAAPATPAQSGGFTAAARPRTSTLVVVDHRRVTCKPCMAKTDTVKAIDQDAGSPDVPELRHFEQGQRALFCADTVQAPAFAPVRVSSFRKNRDGHGDHRHDVPVEPDPSAIG